MQVLGFDPQQQRKNLPSYHTQDVYHQDNKTLEVLAWDKGERNHYTLLLGIQISVITIEIYVEVTQKQNLASVALQGVYL